MPASPKNLRVLKEEGVLEIEWPSGATHRLPFKLLRGRCPCASCVDEFTGIRTLDVNSIPDDIYPTDVQLSGNYAMKFTWSDGHDTGIYTWEHLGRLCRDEQVTTVREGE